MSEMNVNMEVLNIELKKKAPSIMGIIEKPEFDIYRIHCIPVSLKDAQNMGWNKIKELGLENEHSDELAKHFSEDFDVFSCFIPATRNTIEKWNLEPGNVVNVKVMKL